MQLALQVLKKVLPAAACTALLCSSPVLAAGDQPSVPYVPTPQAVVERMLAMAKVTAGDYLIDLGSGDGRIVVTAASKYGARGFGVDLNPERIDEANDNARRNRVTDKVAFYQRNLFDTDLSQATVITMYLLPRVNLQLRPKLLDLKPGTRLVSHDFDMGDWKADEHVRMGANDKFSGAGGESDVYLWIVPAKVAGTWRSRLTAAGKPQTYEIRLEQKYQSVGGSVRVNGKPALIQGAKLSGAELTLSFTAEINGAPVKHEFSGRVDGGRMAGEAALSGKQLASRVEWIAERTEAAR
ncbi:MAG: class I SAM-dependent methyltransferase [Burkholderiales bacterium]|nr:class I SAM-dependent methyltransferase [Burkholderiales bacterium]